VLETFHADVERGAIPAARANALIRDLARVLVPVNFTRGPRFRHDPALPIPPLPDLALCGQLDGLDANDLAFAQTTLLRGRNRVTAALREAARRVTAAQG